MAFPYAAPSPAITYRAQAVVAAPVVAASSESLSQSAERITLNGTGFDRRPGHNVVAFDGGVTGKVVSATPTALVVRLTHKPSGLGALSAAVTTNGRSSGAPVSVATIVNPPRVTIGFPTLPRPGKLTAMVTANGGSSGQSAQVATVDSATYSLVSDLSMGEYVETFQYSSVGITAGYYVVFTMTDFGDDEVDEVDGTTYDTSGSVITGVWSAPVDSSNLQTFTITALQVSYGYYKFNQYEPAGLISEFAVYSSAGTLLASGSATQVTT